MTIDTTAAAIAERLKTQDNHATREPLYLVQQRRRMTGLDPRFSGELTWWNSPNQCEATPEEFERLEAAYQESYEEPDDWIRSAYVDTWEFVTVCLTEAAARAYIAANAHNLTDPRVFVDSAHRNDEMIAVRRMLLDGGASASRGWQQADSLHLSVKEQRERADTAERLNVETLELLKTSLEVLVTGPTAEAIAELRAEVAALAAALKGPHALVLGELAEERQRQEAKWGEQNHPDLSPEVPTSTVERAAEDMCLPSAHVARSRVENLAARGKLGYADIALEEFAEAIEAAALGVTAELRKELVQTAAVLVAWIQSIDRRRSRARK